MSVSVPKIGDQATDIYLMDEVVAVRINDAAYHFYTQPLVRSEPVVHVPFAPIDLNTFNIGSDRTEYDYNMLID